MSGFAVAALGSLGLLAYGHVIYPAAMIAAARLLPARRPPHQTRDEAAVPSIAVLVPAFNEARVIARKIETLAAADYPRDRLRVVIGDDGSWDGTAREARRAASRNPALNVEVVAFAENRGKVAVLNELVAGSSEDLVVFTDASALLPENALRRMAAHFADQDIGAVGVGYEAFDLGADEVAAYWSAQTRIKIGESRVSGLIGAHGAGYAVRRTLFEPLPVDAINDDFLIPMLIATRPLPAARRLTYPRTIYDPSVSARELDRVAERDDFHRRKRIAAGNLQQLAILMRRRGFWRPSIALAVLSGKGVRAATPFLLAAGFLGAALGASEHPYLKIAAAGQTAFVAAALAGLAATRLPVPLRLLGYALKGTAAAGIGSVEYLAGVRRRPGRNGGAQSYVPVSVRVAKRAFDIVAALSVLIATAPVTAVIAVAIRIDSPGPVFFRQWRVGEMRPNETRIFRMIKFRSMRTDAEATTGAVWATKRDPRVTRVGGFLRKTRLDEIPQMINVLKGEMSIIGPRPERPSFYGRLEAGVPFYVERTFGLRPGVTGLAQINQGYDRDIEDVRRKSMYDHAYAASLSSFGHWLARDLEIATRTFLVMILGRGQ